MAEWPANGETDWNTKQLAYLAVEHETDGTHQENITYAIVDSVKTKVLTKYFTGTTDADNKTEVPHGISNIDDILSVTGCIFNSGGSVYSVYSRGNSAALLFELNFDGTNVSFNLVDATFQSQKYRIKVDYI
jgi:hypothetical protein